VVGPPGTGKTRALANAVIGVLVQGIKAMVIGPSNKAVDQAANTVYKRFPDEGRAHFLRCEVKSAELRAMLKVKNMKDQNPNECPQVEELWDIDEAEALQNAIGTAVSE